MNVGCPSNPGGVRAISGTDSIQVWNRGYDEPTLPCLDNLDVRQVANKLLQKIANEVDSEVYTRIPDPISLEVVRSTRRRRS